MKGERTINRAKYIFLLTITVVRSSQQTAKLKIHRSILGIRRSSTKHLDGLRGSPFTSVGTKGSCFGDKGA